MTREGRMSGVISLSDVIVAASAQNFTNPITGEVYPIYELVSGTFEGQFQDISTMTQDMSGIPGGGVMSNNHAFTGRMSLSGDFANDLYSFSGGGSFSESGFDPFGGDFSFDGSEFAAAYWSGSQGCASQLLNMQEEPWIAPDGIHCYDPCANDGMGGEIAAVGGLCTTTCTVNPHLFAVSGSDRVFTVDPSIATDYCASVPTLLTDADLPSEIPAPSAPWDCAIPASATTVSLTTENLMQVMNSCGNPDDMPDRMDCRCPFWGYEYRISDSSTCFTAEELDSYADMRTDLFCDGLRAVSLGAFPQFKGNDSECFMDSDCPDGNFCNLEFEFDFETEDAPMGICMPDGQDGFFALTCPAQPLFMKGTLKATSIIDMASETFMLPPDDPCSDGGVMAITGCSADISGFDGDLTFNCTRGESACTILVTGIDMRSNRGGGEGDGDEIHLPEQCRADCAGVQDPSDATPECVACVTDYCAAASAEDPFCIQVASHL